MLPGMAPGLFLWIVLLYHLFFWRLDGVDDFPGGGVDSVQGCFQLCQLPAPAPPGQVAKGIVGGVQSEVLAHHIC